MRNIRVPLRATDHHPTWVSYQDCTRGAYLPFEVDLDLSTPDMMTKDVTSFEVWLGKDASNCADPAVRKTSCQELYQELVQPAGGKMISLAFKAKEDIIAKGLGYTDGCDQAIPSDGVAIQLWFILIRDKSTPVLPDDYVVYADIKIDLVGPGAPTNVTLAATDKSIGVRFEENDAEAESFLVFRDPSTPSAASGAAGAGGMGGASGACTSMLLTPGKVPADDVEALGQISNTTSIQLNGLDGDTTYKIAVAGVDAVGNVGPLSNLVCGTLQSPDAFWKEYCEDSGGACASGKCSCSAIGASGTTFWPALFTLGLPALGLFPIRRRHRTARRPAGASRS